jgi:molybdopterin/thiamine biosynthesis adenylyltransferase
MAKLACGAERLRDLNPHIDIDEHACALSRDNAREIISRYDLVADGADNFATRYLVNDACVLENKPLVSASILAFEGQLAVYNYDGGPCYRCLFPIPPPPGMAPSCAEGGVLGILPGVMGTLQATEVMRLRSRASMYKKTRNVQSAGTTARSPGSSITTLSAALALPQIRLSLSYPRQRLPNCSTRKIPS